MSKSVKPFISFNVKNDIEDKVLDATAWRFLNYTDNSGFLNIVKTIQDDGIWVKDRVWDKVADELWSTQTSQTS